jgi:hypothetical protein
VKSLQRPATLERVWGSVESPQARLRGFGSRALMVLVGPGPYRPDCADWSSGGISYLSCVYTRNLSLNAGNLRPQRTSNANVESTFDAALPQRR